MIHHLEQVVASAEGRPARGSADHPMRAVTRRVAFEPGGWSPDDAAQVQQLFDSLAPEWHTRADPHRFEPIIDAFNRGGPLPPGLVVELGSGTGLLTPMLAERFPRLVAIDLSSEMLSRAPDVAPKVQADCSRLPLRDGAATVAVLMNMLLFPHEIDRVLAADGVMIWVNTSGDETPIYLPAEDVVAALPGAWDAVAADAGWGTWAVARRATT